MKDQTGNQEILNRNTTWTINTDDLDLFEKIDYVRSKNMDNMYNENTTWTTNEKNSKE
jgi:hypothetical protein